ncbi:class I SAM-dependent methyltransferase [Marinobacter sp. chi1]|uniref:Class I SAM-dependent methyltransferase n=1 Tax=Marinobacter suaedae TaxID=3057675 RepID=A0ABT8VY60_9GAMM|nr:class I SAM-dependent methyltransferase [Marinobacter sp. chi1]MDO3720933.1 class I SAM-dependent methyltransferase [Marinobacter sp. chi1]
MRDKYKYIGPLYDFLSSIYGGEAIHNCKRAMLTPEYVQPGDKVLIAGVGHGKDAIRAAEIGADVTVVDISETMLKKLEAAFAKHPDDLKVRVVHADILKFEEFERYDMVIANFFLNVFGEDFMRKLLSHLVRCVKPGGSFVIGDFSYPSGNLLARAAQKLYWYTAAVIFYFASDNAVHEIYNYPVLMEAEGLGIKDTRRFSYLGMNCYTSVLGYKPA